MVAVLSGPLLTSSFELNVLLCATLAMLTLWLIPGYLSAGTRDYITTFLTAVAAARRQPDAP
jgi:hypothetical protein